MKATGIVRRIDDLGRVVIPKEIRRTMRIREGDPLEIYTDTEGEVVFKKYSPIGELGVFSHQYVEVLYKVSGIPIAICDRDVIISISGMPKKEMIDKKISSDVENIINERKFYISGEDTKTINVVDGIDSKANIIAPIVTSGDVSGAVIMFLNSGKEHNNESNIKIIKAASMFLSKQMEG